MKTKAINSIKFIVRTNDKNGKIRQGTNAVNKNNI